jgi:heterodisulfide reductase subunit B2
MNKYSYYPGCSLEVSCKPYDDSVKAVFAALNIPLKEIEDWNCCGATLTIGVAENSAAYLSARNMAIAEKEGNDLEVPCSACFTALKKQEHVLSDRKDIKEKVNANLKEEGLEYKGTIKVRHVLDILVNDAEKEIKASVKKPLKGMKVAAYYGCQIVRPKSGLDDADNPVILDNLVSWLGAEPTAFPAKTRCCAALLMQTRPEVAQPMAAEILESAKLGGADCIVTACPLCMINLESYQKTLSSKYKKDLNIPVLYFTQLMGIAAGIPADKLGIKGNFINPDKALAKAGN